MTDRPEYLSDPAGDIISPRIQYLEEWIRDCQRYNRNVGASLAAANDRIKDLESLVATKNVELSASRKRLAELGDLAGHLATTSHRWEQDAVQLAALVVDFDADTTEALDLANDVLARHNDDGADDD